MFRFTRLRRAALAVVACAAATFPAHAIGVDDGDYAYAPDRTVFNLVYLQHFEAKGLYAQGKKVSDTARLSGDVMILRSAQYFDVLDHHSLVPQFLLPMGQFSTGGSLKGAGVTSGVGDLILALPFHFNRDVTGREDLAVTTYLWVPTGDYNRNNLINPLGENRWKLALQLGSTNKLSESVSLELVGDVRLQGRNGDFGPSGATMTQKPLYEWQTHLRYFLTPGSFLGANVSWILGGETRVNGVDQDDRQRQTKMLFTLGHMLRPDLQILGSVGKDASVRTGLKEESRFNLRVLKIY